MLFFWLLVLAPLIEIWVMIEVGQVVGAWWTIVLIVLTAMIGTIIMRRQGLRALADLQASLADLRDPSRPLAHGVLILLAGVLLFIPGFVTDTLGALLLVPPVREWLMRRLAQRVVVVAPGSAAPRGTRASSGPGGRVIDAEFEVVDEGSRARAPGDDNGSSRESGARRRPSGWTRG